MKINRITYFRITIFLLLSLITILVLAIKKSSLTYHDITLHSPSGVISAEQMPLYKSSNETGIYVLKGAIEKGTYAGGNVQIIPDDEIISLQLNAQNISLDDIPESSRRDYKNGFIFNLGEKLTVGENKFEIILRDTGGMMGISIKSSRSENLTILLFLTIGVLISYIIFHLNISLSFKLLMTCALLIRIFYFTITPPDTRTHDYTEHLEYSEYLSKHWLPPSIENATGGAYFHPPLYYYTGAIVLKVSEQLGATNKQILERAQQGLSLVYSLGFVFFGLLILSQLTRLHKNTFFSEGINCKKNIISYKNFFYVGKNRLGKLINYPQEFITINKDIDEPKKIGFIGEIKKNGLFLTIGAMFIFWPSSIIHGTRIGNDPLLYCLFAASLYYIILWFQLDQKRDLMIASILSAATIITKANGEVLIAVIALIGLYKMIKAQRWAHYFKLSILPSIIVLIALTITIGPGLALKIQGKRDKLYIDNINNVSSALQVGNTAANYLWFDTKIFITQPFTSPWDDEKGRQYFWNYLNKTGLFGEFSYSSQLSTNAATVTSALYLMMVIYIIFGIYHMRRETIKQQAVLLLAGFFLLAGITYMRMTFPVNIDFRYILPILITFSALYYTSIMTFLQLGATRLAGIGIALAILFSISNLLFVFGI